MYSAQHPMHPFEDHLQKLETILSRLQSAGLKVNAKKSFFARGELEYLGYWINQEGIQPLASKVSAIQNIIEPKQEQEGSSQVYRYSELLPRHVDPSFAHLSYWDQQLEELAAE